MGYPWGILRVSYGYAWGIFGLFEGLTPRDRLIQLDQLGPPGTVTSLLRMARWISPLRVQSPCLLVDPLVLHVPLIPPTAAVPLIPVMWHFLSRSKVHGRVQGPVEFRYPLLHTALLPCPRSLHSLSISILGLQTLLLSILGFQTVSISILSLQTFSLSILDLQTLSFSIQVSKLSSQRRYYANSPRIW